MSGRVRDTCPTTDRTDTVRIGMSDVREHPRSPLVAALAQAVLDQHVKRAGLVSAVVGNVGPMERHKADETWGGGATSQHRERPALHVIEGGRGAQPEP